MTHVTEDDLDDLEFDTLRTGDHTSAARRLSELAESVSGGVSRANVLLRAGETVDVLLDVTNPGVWMVHCHIAEHLEGGMMLTFHVQEPG